MKFLHEKLIEAEKDGYEVYEVTYLERRMTERHWEQVQDHLDGVTKGGDQAWQGLKDAQQLKLQ